MLGAGDNDFDRYYNGEIRSANMKPLVLGNLFVSAARYLRKPLLAYEARKKEGTAIVRRLSLLILAVAWPTISLAWVAPVGIPAPPWPADVDLASPALPSAWTSDQPGFYFVSPTGCSDSRSSGHPGAPRCSLPSSPPQGSVIVLSGTISGDLSISYTTGTAASPVWIVGYPQVPPTITGSWTLSGSYVILADLVFRNAARDGNLDIIGNRIMVRNSSFVDTYGSSNGSGVGIGGKNVVFYKNTIPQQGNWQYTGPDVDRHGIKVYTGADNVWILDSSFYHCQGDGVQVGDQNNSAAQVNRIYIGRNTAYENAQFGFWTKNATDVIFSENTAYNLQRDTDSGPGGGFGGQYDAKYVWFLLNKAYNSNTGIHVAGASSGSGGPWYMIGNVIYGIQYPGGCNAYDMGGLGFRNAGSCGMFFNTVYDTDAFVALAPGGGTTTIRNNIFAAKRTPCSAFENDGASFTHDYNLFSQSSYDPGSEAHRVVGDPKFVNPAAFDFRLQATSPAINMANPAEEAAFSVFRSRYGLDIRKDILGVTRPQGTAWDIGAYEVVQGRLPVPPANLRIQ